MSKRRRKRKFTVKHLSIAKKALRRVKRLERKVEVKTFDVVVHAVTPALAGLIEHVNVIAQGDTIQNRDGLSCNLIGFKLNYRITLNAAATAAEIRILIVRDNRQVESTNPSVLDVLLSADPISQRTRVNPKRFTIYYDKVHVLDDSSQRIVYRSVFRKAKFKQVWVGAAGTTHTKNGLYVISISDLSGNLPSFKFSFRCWFVDM